MIQKIFPFLSIVCILTAISCSQSPPPLDAQQEQQATTLDNLAKKSGGDWNALSDAEKQSAIQIAGSEQGAKMLLLGKSGKLHGPAGGPKGGPGH